MAKEDPYAWITAACKRPCCLQGRPRLTSAFYNLPPPAPDNETEPLFGPIPRRFLHRYLCYDEPPTSTAPPPPPPPSEINNNNNINEFDSSPFTPILFQSIENSPPGGGGGGGGGGVEEHEPDRIKQTPSLPQPSFEGNICSDGGVEKADGSDGFALSVEADEDETPSLQDHAFEEADGFSPMMVDSDGFSLSIEIDEVVDSPPILEQHDTTTTICVTDTTSVSFENEEPRITVKEGLGALSPLNIDTSVCTLSVEDEPPSLEELAIWSFTYERSFKVVDGLSQGVAILKYLAISQPMQVDDLDTFFVTKFRSCVFSSPEEATPIPGPRPRVVRSRVFSGAKSIPAHRSKVPSCVSRSKKKAAYSKRRRLSDGEVADLVSDGEVADLVPDGEVSDLVPDREVSDLVKSYEYIILE